MNSQNVPKHLVATAKAGFLAATKDRSAVSDYKLISETFDMTKNSDTLTDLGAAPGPVEEGTGTNPEDFIEKFLDIKPKNWTQTVWLSYNTEKDDQTSTLLRKVQSAGDEFEDHINERVFQTLNAGDLSTFGIGYDGLTFFNDSHVDKGAKYTTVQDNLFALALSPANFETVWAAGRLLKNDQGKYMNLNHHLIVTDPTQRQEAFQIGGNPKVAGGSLNDLNSFSGEVTFLTNPNIDAGSWMALNTRQRQKPLLVAMREKPHLQHSWFDPKAKDGGRWYFKFYARYNVFFGDWRLALMGKT